MIHLTGRIFRGESQWISHCNELDIMTCGKTIDEAWRRTSDMIDGYFRTCAQLGTLAETLRRLHGAALDDVIRVRSEFTDSAGRTVESEQSVLLDAA